MPRASPYGQDGWNHLREISTQSAYINSSASLERGNRFQGLQSGFRQKLRPHKLRLDDPALRNIEVRTNSVRLLVICGPAFRLFIYACAITYPFFEIYFLFRPGPIVYRNNFPAFILSICLAFICLQVFLLERGVTTYTLDTWRRRATQAFWTVVMIAALAQNIAYLVAVKYDCIGVSVFMIIVSCLAWNCLLALDKKEVERYLQEKQSTLAEAMEVNLQRAGQYNPTSKKMIVTTQASPRRKTRRPSSMPCRLVATPKDGNDDIPWWKSSKTTWIFVAIAMRPVRAIYVIIAIMNVVGSIQVARQSRLQHQQPGERITIHVPGYGNTNVNYFCTTRSAPHLNGKSLVWFEGSTSQGIMDFMGVQHHLLDYQIASCSYDPPSFGGSDALKVQATEYSAWQPALIQALRDTPFDGAAAWDNRTYVGVGGEGTKLAIEHASSDESAFMVIALDPLPVGAEYLLEQAKHNWTDAERQRYQLSEAKKKATIYSLALSFGVSWGFLFKFKSLFPQAPENFYPNTSLPAWQAQKRNDDHLALEYWQILGALDSNAEDHYLQSHKLPNTTLLHTILSLQSKEDEIDQSFWKKEMMDVLAGLGGKQRNPVWCFNCTSDFVISDAKRTAKRIADMISKPGVDIVVEDTQQNTNATGEEASTSSSVQSVV